MWSKLDRSLSCYLAAFTVKPNFCRWWILLSYMHMHLTKATALWCRVSKDLSNFLLYLMLVYNFKILQIYAGLSQANWSRVFNLWLIDFLIFLMLYSDTILEEAIDAILNSIVPIFLVVLTRRKTNFFLKPYLRRGLVYSKFFKLINFFMVSSNFNLIGSYLDIEYLPKGNW